MNLLPAGLPTPRLVGTHDDGEWVALVFSDVDGRHPQLPGTDLRAVLDAVDAISARPLSPEAVEVLPSLTDEVRDIFGGWARLRNDPHTGLDPWALQHHALLESLSATAADTVGGDRLAHVDLRADNVLIDRDGRAIIVDWPWAAHGASWFDALTLLVDARVNDPACDAESALREHAVFASAGPQQVDSVLAALAGYFLDNARKPSPPGLPTLRAFQRRKGQRASDGWGTIGGGRGGSGDSVIGQACPPVRHIWPLSRAASGVCGKRWSARPGPRGCSGNARAWGKVNLVVPRDQVQHSGQSHCGCSSMVER